MAEKVIPEYQRQVEVQPNSGTPAFGSAFRELAKADNIIGDIGATVAQNASQQMAQQLGYEMGKNPHGDLIPPLTDFDRNLEKSYSNQAHATLSLQATKLLDDTEIELSKAQTLTPDLIATANHQAAVGLQKITSLAPTSIKGQLEYQLGSQLLQQNENLQKKMIGQQREDYKNNLIASSNQSLKNIFNLAIGGNQEAAEAMVKSTVDSVKNGAGQDGSGNRYLTPDMANNIKESAEVAALNGKYIKQALDAKAEGKLEPFLKNVLGGSKPPAGVSYDRWTGIARSVTGYLGNIKALDEQDEHLRAAKMLNSIAEDVNGITGTQWKEFESNVSPAISENVKHHYIQALKGVQQDKSAMNSLISNFSSPDLFARAPEKAKNQAFDTLVNALEEQNLKNGTPITHDDAQVRVASAAGGKVPAFISSIENKLSSGNADQMESAAQIIHKLTASAAGHALEGLSDHAKAAAVKYEALRSSMPPPDAAKETNNLIYNQDPEIAKMNKERWSNFLTTSIKGGIIPTDFALRQVGYSKNDFVNPGVAVVAGNDILEKFSTYYQILNGDKDSALRLTKQFVTQNYGETGVNGNSHVTLHPLEKVLGYQDKDVVPYIHEDVANQLNKQMEPIKKLYADKKMNEYWEVLPVSKETVGFFGHKHNPLQIQRYSRVGTKEVVDKFDVVLQGNAFDSWDVSINSPTGMRNIFQIAPYLGVISYFPNKKAIDESYNKDHKL